MWGVDARYDFFTPALLRTHFTDPPTAMTTIIKKTISLPADLARDAEAAAWSEGKTLGAVIQDALRRARIKRRRQELRGMQGCWSRKVRDKGILTEADLNRYLRD